MGVHYHTPPTSFTFKSNDLKDVDSEVLNSGANNFDFPYDEIPPPQEPCADCSHDALTAFLHGSRHQDK